jgi:hypothetical protein
MHNNELFAVVMSSSGAGAGASAGAGESVARDYRTLSVWLKDYEGQHAGGHFLISLPEFAVRVEKVPDGLPNSFVRDMESLLIKRVYIASERHPGKVYAFVNVPNRNKNATWSVAGGPAHKCMALVPVTRGLLHFKDITYTMPESLEGRIRKGQVFMDGPLIHERRGVFIDGRDWLLPHLPRQLEEWAPLAHSAFVEWFDRDKSFEILQKDDIPLLREGDELYFIQVRGEEHIPWLAMPLQFKDVHRCMDGVTYVRLWAHALVPTDLLPTLEDVYGAEVRSGLKTPLVGVDLATVDEDHMMVRVEVYTRLFDAFEESLALVIAASKGLHDTINHRDEGRRRIRAREVERAREAERRINRADFADWVSLRVASARDSLVAVPGGLAPATSLQDVVGVNGGRIYVVQEGRDGAGGAGYGAGGAGYGAGGAGYGAGGGGSLVGLALDVRVDPLFNMQTMDVRFLSFGTNPPTDVPEDVPSFVLSVSTPTLLMQLISEGRVLLDPVKFHGVGMAYNGWHRRLKSPS